MVCLGFKPVMPQYGRRKQNHGAMVAAPRCQNFQMSFQLDLFVKLNCFGKNCINLVIHFLYSFDRYTSWKLHS